MIVSLGGQRRKLIVSCGFEGQFASGIINILRGSKYKNDCVFRGAREGN